jgi:hypothetical protein
MDKVLFVFTFLLAILAYEQVGASEFSPNPSALRARDLLEKQLAYGKVAGRNCHIEFTKRSVGIQAPTEIASVYSICVKESKWNFPSCVSFKGYLSHYDRKPTLFTVFSESSNRLYLEADTVIGSDNFDADVFGRKYIDLQWKNNRDLILTMGIMGSDQSYDHQRCLVTI